MWEAGDPTFRGWLGRKTASRGNSPRVHRGRGEEARQRRLRKERRVRTFLPQVRRKEEGVDFLKVAVPFPMCESSLSCYVWTVPLLSAACTPRSLGSSAAAFV